MAILQAKGNLRPIIPHAPGLPRARESPTGELGIPRFGAPNGSFGFPRIVIASCSGRCYRPATFICYVKGVERESAIFGLLSLRRDRGSGLMHLDLASCQDPRSTLSPKKDLRFFAPGLGKLPRT